MTAILTRRLARRRAHQPRVNASIQRHVTSQDHMNSHYNQLQLVATGYLHCIQRQTHVYQIQYTPLYQRVRVLQAATDAVHHQIYRVADQIQLIVTSSRLTRTHLSYLSIQYLALFLPVLLLVVLNYERDRLESYRRLRNDSRP